MVRPNRNKPAPLLRPSVARDVLFALGRCDILIALNDAQITPLPSACFEVPHQPTTTTTTATSVSLPMNPITLLSAANGALERSTSGVTESRPNAGCELPIS